MGNVRLAFFDDGNGNPVIDRTTDFYPFGLEFGGQNGLETFGSDSPNYTYAFQGQERQQETGWDSFKWRNYDPSFARFFNVDPLSEKYSYQSHYNFSENRVVDGVELEGLEVQLLVDKGNKNKMDFGHALVSVGSGKNQTVYSYGRWDGGDKGKPIARSTDPSGDGVMVRLTGNDAKEEIKRYVGDYGAKVYEITNANETKVESYLESQFNSSNELPNNPNSKYFENEKAHVIDKYSMTDNNCTTKSLDAIRVGLDGKEIKFTNTTVMPTSGAIIKRQDDTNGTYDPAVLENQMNQASKQKGTGVIDVTNQYE